MKFVDIPDTIITIGDYAFYHCTSLTEIIMPDFVTTMGQYAFHFCTSLQKAELSESLQSISYSSFFDCESLVSIVIPPSVTSIEGGAFQSCKSLVSVVLPNTLQSISGYYAFAHCTSLESIIIPYSVTSMGSSVFNGCTSLSVIYCEPLAMKDVVLWKLGCNAEIYYGKIFNLYSEAAEAAYYILSSYSGTISNFVIPSIYNGLSVVEVWSNAFENCESLISVTIPDSVTVMGENVFNGCTNLTDIYCDASAKPENWNDAWLGNCTATVHWSGSDENPGSEVPDAAKSGIVTESDGTLAYYVDGVKQYGCGLIYLDGYYYHVNSSGVVAVGEYWVSNDNGYGYTGVQQFGEDGKMVVKDGIVTEDDGTLAYYIKNVKQYDKGLIRLESGYYYVNSSGVVVTGDYWITKNNGYGYYGCYTFDETGRLIIKNGIYEESDGTLAYYHYNVKQSDLGLIYYEGYYYYVNSNAQVMTGEYWVTKDNYYPYYGLQNFDENGRLIIE